uniref:Oligosaccharyltransferase complex subunit n=1 Tax=Megaselia scalaris TaxID=36166 RepID=T1H5K6_MEGSC
MSVVSWRHSPQPPRKCALGPLLFFDMFESLYQLPFYLIEPPNLRIRKPLWMQKPPSMIVFSTILLSYFLVTG